MDIVSLGIEGSWLAQSPVWHDERGYFREWFKSGEIESATGYRFSTLQANISSSSKGTVRGIHYSIAVPGQAKWITCVNGAIRDVIVDIRPSSATFGEWISIELSALSGSAVLIGEGLGHAFMSLEDATTVAYLVSSPYSPDEELGVNPLDPEIGINWGLDVTKLRLSEKDLKAPMLKEQRARDRLPKNFSLEK